MSTFIKSLTTTTAAILLAAQLAYGFSGATATAAANKPNENGNAYGVAKQTDKKEMVADDSKAVNAATQPHQSSRNDDTQTNKHDDRLAPRRTDVAVTTTQKVSTETKRNDNPLHKVTICHRTNSNTNPYVRITVDTDAAHGGKDHGKGDHAAEHRGPVWNSTLKIQHIEWGDIIPPYTDDQGVNFPGLNWTAAGQTIYNNGCSPAGGSGGCVSNCGSTNIDCQTNCGSTTTTPKDTTGQVLGATTTKNGQLANTGAAVLASIVMAVILVGLTALSTRFTRKQVA